MSTKKKYHGIVVPAVTPLTPYFQLDEQAVENMFANFRQNGVHPFILGTTGEATSVPVALKHRYLSIAGRLKQAGELLYAGISGNCLEESSDLAKRCFDLGVDVVAATLPSYYALSEAEMIRYFEQLTDNINGPLIIYNIPATTHMSIPLEAIEKLSYHENIIGLKDSERSEERLRASLTLWGTRSDFSHFTGWAGKSAEALLNGSDGLIPSTGNFAPSLYRAMFDAAQESNEAELRRLQEVSDILGNLYQSGRSLGQSLWALKVLMKEMHLCEPIVLPPLMGRALEEEKQLREKLQEIIQEQGIILT